MENSHKEQQIQGDLHRDEEISSRRTGYGLAQDRMMHDEDEALANILSQILGICRFALRSRFIPSDQEKARDRYSVRKRIGRYGPGCTYDCY
jgi:hypothetical protein